MRRNLAGLGISVVILSCGLCLDAQQSDSGNDAASANAQAASAQPDGSAAGPAASATGTVPRLVKFSGVVKDSSGKVRTGQLTLTLSLYEEHQGGSPLWVEMQNVQPDE